WIMSHIDEGLLRRAQDEPEILTLGERAHLEECAGCRELAAVIATDSAAAAALLGAFEPVDIESALARFKAAEASREDVSRWRAWTRLASRRPAGGIARRPRLALAGAIALVATSAGALFVTGTAKSFISVFQPTHVAAGP